MIRTPIATVIHLVPDLRQQAGGIASTIPSLASALSDLGFESRFVTYSRDSDFLWMDQTICVPKTNILRTGKLDRLIEEMLAELPARVPAVLHSHGLWDMLNHSGLFAARKTCIPTVLSLHGMLLPWARRHKKLRKDIAWQFYQRRDLVQADAVHVTSRAEADTISGVIPSECVHTIPFGVSLSRVAAPPLPDNTNRTLLFLGRLHPVKNLEALIRAFMIAAPEQSRLRLIGPDESNHKATLLALIDTLNAGERISISGPSYGAAKEAAIVQADGIILPSFTENFGAVVAEALAFGRPVISSTGAPWEILRIERCGWWVGPDVNSLAQAIGSFYSTSRDDLRAMGERGRAYALSSLSQDTAAARMAELYSSVLFKPVSSGPCS